MHIQTTAMSCMECNHYWAGEMVVNAPVEVWAAALMATRCPACGSKVIALGRGNVPDPEPAPDNMTDTMRRAAWLALCDNGLSSECIADTMCGIRGDNTRRPYDGADFGRCERLLMLYPQWRARLPEMMAVNPAWAALVPRWDEVAAAWQADKAARRDGPWVCATLMDSIFAPSPPP